MLRKLTALAATFAFALTTLTPVAADARNRRDEGYWGGRHDDGYYDHRRRHRDDNDDEVAAGVLGLVLGVALGAALSQPRQAPPRAQCHDNYQRCAPPSQYYEQGYDQDGYYEDPRSAYEQDYGYAPQRYEEQRPQRMCRERQWDRYANRYLMVDVPC